MPRTRPITAAPPASAGLLKSVEVAALLNVHPKHVYRLLRRGLPGQRVGGDWRFDRDEVLRWAGALKQPAPVASPIEVKPTSGGALLAANGDIVVDLLLEHINEAPPLLGFVRADRDRALALLAAGEVLLAGSHGRAFPPTVAETRLARINLVDREVGLVAPAGKPVPAPSRLGRLRFGYRPQSAGVVVHLEAVAREEGLDLGRMLARAVVLGSHREVVFAVLRGTVDVGLATRAWAEALGLGFRPLAVESYGLLVRATELARVEIVRLCEVAQSRRFLDRVTAIPGYVATNCGAIRYDATP
jgi:putative molybdopterin biosynthesis protein